MDLRLDHTANNYFSTLLPVNNESMNSTVWDCVLESGSDRKVSPTQQLLSTSLSHPSNRRTNARLAKSSVAVMEQWLKAHAHSPYPTEEDKYKLKQETGLTLSQVSSWFSNARKRGKVRPPPPAPTRVVYSPYTESEFPDLPVLHPFERWLKLGPEHEAVSLVRVNEAIKANDDIKPVCLPDSRSRCRGGKWQFSHRHGSSTSSLDIRSYGSEVPDIPLVEYSQANTASTLIKCEPRRRRGAKSVAAVPETSRRLYCTFCPKSFRTKHDWQRHEKSQHLALERWTCAPHGSGVDVDPQTNKITCTFCNTDDPSPEHLQAHRFTACITRPISERIFFRKDHLCQHLKLAHGSCVFRDSMRAWRTCRDDVRSRCGFCDTVFETWSCRVKHLVDHFSEGKTMPDWKGDWGLDSDVSRILENATLPELFTKSMPLCMSATSSITESCHTLNL